MSITQQDLRQAPLDEEGRNTFTLALVLPEKKKTFKEEEYPDTFERFGEESSLGAGQTLKEKKPFSQEMKENYSAIMEKEETKSLIKSFYDATKSLGLKKIEQTTWLYGTLWEHRHLSATPSIRIKFKYRLPASA